MKLLYVKLKLLLAVSSNSDKKKMYYKLTSLPRRTQNRDVQQSIKSRWDQEYQKL